jgi:hypothetical protein
MDKTGKMSEEEEEEEVAVLPPRYASRLFRSSFTTALSVLVAAQNGLWGCAAVALLVLLTSLNYWRRPVRGWRRSADMAAVFGAIVYHVYCCAHCDDALYQAAYVLSVANTGFCYFQARRASDQHVSSAWHCAMHVLGNLGNMLLYVGLSL